MCGKVGHFSRICRGKSAKFSKKISARQKALSPYNANPLCATYASACPGGLAKASIRVILDGTKLTTLVDSGSSESYINSATHQSLGLEIIPPNHSAQMASAAMKIKSSGFCVADVTINDTTYAAVRLNILGNLCSDMILGLDFLSQHQRLIFELNGNALDLVVANELNCALDIADTKEDILLQTCQIIKNKSLFHFLGVVFVIYH